jgi:hypothetical protein
MELSRRALLKRSVGILGSASLASAQLQDPLPSWNAGPAKQGIVDFVRATTNPSSAKFVRTSLCKVPELEKPTLG